MNNEYKTPPSSPREAYSNKKNTNVVDTKDDIEDRKKLNELIEKNRKNTTNVFEHYRTSKEIEKLKKKLGIDEEPNYDVKSDVESDDEYEPPLKRTRQNENDKKGVKGGKSRRRRRKTNKKKTRKVKRKTHKKKRKGNKKRKTRSRTRRKH